MIPYIVDLLGMEKAEKERVVKRIDSFAAFSPVEKANTAQLYFLHEKKSVSEMAVLLSVEESRITVAEGWDLKQWLRQ